MSCHLASQGRLLIKILLSTGFLYNTKTAGMRSEIMPGSVAMGNRLIPVSNLEFSVFGDPEGFIPDPSFPFIPDPSFPFIPDPYDTVPYIRTVPTGAVPL
jgi:hypothetical protein